MFHPSRGGVRGGKDQFSWEAVKEDKYRENYLGHSLMAPVGRWQKGKDLTWYAKDKAGESSRKAAEREELRRIKEAEADAMAVALGVKKKKTIESNVTQEELRHALKNTDSDEEDGHSRGLEEKGLGYGRSTRLIPSTGSNAIEIMNAPAPTTLKDEDRVSYSSVQERETATVEKKKKKEKKSKKHKSDKKKRRRHGDYIESEDEEERSRPRRHRRRDDSEDEHSRRSHRRRDRNDSDDNSGHGSHHRRRRHSSDIESDRRSHYERRR
ncbi:hypothetical protein EC973_006547 [Apophysomyces ossiformis]|uniref:Multiple myeloma tumor-associated protein 2-like N-terminal domain-containing protein n=1 Tax=Apophysomyces ossiformis TaxID=679940 RepID=A0A8H7BT57_9FUNG|nr:hypothetical protein EC973_006547 [Apophysomyces ossiformis]